MDMDIEHLAKLARLKLTDAEKERFSKQMGTIIEYIEAYNKMVQNEMMFQISLNHIFLQQSFDIFESFQIFIEIIYIRKLWVTIMLSCIQYQILFS